MTKSVLGLVSLRSHVVTVSSCLVRTSVKVDTINNRAVDVNITVQSNMVGILQVCAQVIVGAACELFVKIRTAQWIQRNSRNVVRSKR